MSRVRWVRFSHDLHPLDGKPPIGAGETFVRLTDVLNFLIENDGEDLAHALSEILEEGPG